MRRVIVLGSTGSVGTQALDLIARYPERFKVVGLSANTSAELLAEQAKKFAVPLGSTALGAVAAAELVRNTEAEVVVHGINGSAGLEATLAALQTGKSLALANKESLIVGGSLVTDLAAPNQIVPVDSEHSAIAQALLSGQRSEVAKLILTASGGPFRGFSAEALEDVTVEQALKHPTWSMGQVISINSASMVNKGLEMIEAQLLFDIPIDQIEVTVHRQSIVHSMVEFVDGSVIAQCSTTDMKLPLALALDWPKRVPGAISRLDWSSAQSWDFEPLDEQVFRSVPLAREVARKGSTYPAVYNAANEEAVAAFLSRKISFGTIFRIIDQALESHVAASEMTLDSVLDAENWARNVANQLIGQRN